MVLLSGCVDGVHDDDSMAAAAWALAAEPDFLVPGGVAHGDSIHFFGISNGEFAHDGNAIVTLGRGANTVVVIGGDGQVVEVLGGSGDGPKEFRGLPWLLRVGEGLIAVDRAGRRYFELVGLAGWFLRSRTPVEGHERSNRHRSGRHRIEPPAR